MITKDITISNEFMKKQNLQSKSVHKGLGTTKVVFLLSTAPPNVGFTKEKHAFIIKKYCSLACCQISSSALDRARVFKVLAVRHLTMMLEFQLTWHALDRVP
jgi:hypothetical protein